MSRESVLRNPELSRNFSQRFADDDGALDIRNVLLTANGTGLRQLSVLSLFDFSNMRNYTSPSTDGNSSSPTAMASILARSPGCNEFNC